MLKLRLMRPTERGQVLALFALGLLVFLGAAALTIDYGYWLQERRNLQNAADAAAQAGISELLTRPITPAKQEAASEHAMLYLDDQLGMGLEVDSQIKCAAARASDPSENGFGPEDGCGSYGGPDRIFIRTPVAAGMGCTGASWGDRALRVGITHGSTRFFSRIYSVGNPDVSVCATSAIYGGSLAIAVLKPNGGPQPLQPNNDNLTMRLAGQGTKVKVIGGDVAINASFSGGPEPPPQAIPEPAYLKFMEGSGAGISQNHMYLTIDNPSPPSWSETAKQIRTESFSLAEDDDLYHDPRHLQTYVPIPFWPAGAFEVGDPDRGVIVINDPTDPGNGSCAGAPPGTIQVLPGKYRELTVSDADVWLCPGVYHFMPAMNPDKGLNIGTNGVVRGQGVTLAFENDSDLVIAGGSGGGNGGALFLNSASAGGLETPALWDTQDFRHDQPISIWIEQTGCNPLAPGANGCSGSDVFKMSAGANLSVRGIIFGPNDNMTIAGQGDQFGTGEVWAWTLEYKGGSVLTQEYEGSDDGWPLIVE